ncbi:MAG: glycosyltransferase [Planctomycetota bacterium]|nr:glycosyltransferase [Planctomycetota bacterium]
MRIGFDTSVLVRPCPNGVVRATRGLVEALERRRRIDVVRLAPRPCERVSTWRHFRMSRAMREHGLAGIHSPVSAFPVLGRGARVATIHEIPWARDVDENSDWKHRLWARVGPLRADAIVVPSDATACFVREGSPLAADRVHVAPWGVAAEFSAENTRHDEHVLARHDLARVPFVLLAGATRPKKNAWIALTALARMERDVVVVVTGALHAHIVEELARSGADARRVRLPGEVDDATLTVLTRHAIASALVSDSEGFGFPVVEAQASGTPVIVPHGSTQAEIAGAGALFIEPRSSESFANAVAHARSNRGEIANLGRTNVARYTWDSCAARIEQLWESLA